MPKQCPMPQDSHRTRANTGQESRQALAQNIHLNNLQPHVELLLAYSRDDQENASAFFRFISTLVASSLTSLAVGSTA